MAGLCMAGLCMAGLCMMDHLCGRLAMTPSPGLAFATLAGTLASLGLAVLGMGGFAAFFSHPSRVVLVIIVAVLAVSSLFSGGNLSAGEREDRRNRWVLIVFALLGVLMAYLPPYTDRIGFWVFGGDGVRWLGVIVFAVGGLLRMWPVFVLGNRFSGLVAIQPGHALETHGVYRLIRHPSYVGLLVNSLGWALAFRSGVGVLLTAIMIVPVLARIRSEEALLLTHFGAEYDAYRRRTARLVPWVY